MNNPPEIICWKKDQQWYVGLEIAESTEVDNQIFIAQNSELIHANNNCFPLNSLEGKLEIFIGNEESLIDLAQLHPLIFKLTDKYLERGRYIKRPAAGSYLVIAADDWILDKALIKTAPASPERVYFPGYTAHIFDIVANKISKLAFRNSKGNLKEIICETPTVALFGQKLPESSDPVSPLSVCSPRVRRLRSDYERISTRFEGWPLIQVELADGQPPDLYRIWYNINGLHVATDGRILERDEHVLEIRLGLEYPRRAPQLRLLTPLFHPNFNNNDVCAQDIYAASEGLDDLIIRIGRMIAYQEYNTKSPLNGIAAKWAAENSHRLPVDGREIAPLASGTHVSPPRLLTKSPPPEDDSWEDRIVIKET